MSFHEIFFFFFLKAIVEGAREWGCEEGALRDPQKSTWNHIESTVDLKWKTGLWKVSGREVL